MRWNKLAQNLRRWASDDSAATATEYAVMLALVLVVIIGAVGTLGQTLNSEYQNIESTLFP